MSNSTSEVDEDSCLRHENPHMYSLHMYCHFKLPRVSISRMIAASLFLQGQPNNTTFM